MRTQDEIEIQSDKIGFVLMSAITFIIMAVPLLATSSDHMATLAVEVAVPCWPAALIASGIIITIKKRQLRYGISFFVCGIIAIGLALLLIFLKDPALTIARYTSVVLGILLFLFPRVPAKILPRVY